MKLVYDVNEKPVMSKTIVFALQQMIAIMAATLLVPMLVTSFGLEADPAAALFGAGIGTLVYIFFTKKKRCPDIDNKSIFDLFTSIFKLPTAWTASV